MTTTISLKQTVYWTVRVQYRAGGQQTAESRALTAGWLVSRSGAWLTTALCSRCLFSRRCMRSWRSRGWPLSLSPEAARPSPPFSLPSMAGLPGGTQAFPRWRERSRCTCVHKTPPLGGTVRGSRPKPVSWQTLSRPKLIVLRARQPLPCTPWLSCRFTKPRHSNRCTRVLPTRGWCRSCARRLNSLYEWKKSQRGPSGRRCPPWWSRSAISGSTWQRWRTSTRHAFSMPPSPRRGCSVTPSRALPSSSQRYSSRPRRSSTSCPAWCTIHRCPQGQACFLTLAHDPFCQLPREYGSGMMYLPTHLWPVPFGTQGVRWGCLRTHRLLYHLPLLPFTALTQVCRLCRWSRDTNTFARFYSLRIEPVSSRVLGNR